VLGLYPLGRALPSKRGFLEKTATTALTVEASYMKPLYTHNYGEPLRVSVRNIVSGLQKRTDEQHHYHGFLWIYNGGEYIK